MDPDIDSAMLTLEQEVKGGAGYKVGDLDDNNDWGEGAPPLAATALVTL